MIRWTPRSVPLLSLAVACWTFGYAADGHAAEAREPRLDGGRGRAVELDKAPAPLSYSIEVLVLHATNSGQGIDKRVDDMPELKKPPFSAYDSYQLLAKKRLPLVLGDPKTYRLPNGRVLKTDLKEKPQGETFKISASINQPKGKAFLPLLEVRAGLGQAFIVAGQSFKSGILVLVLKVIKD